jgi:hypothetical protein
MRRSAAALGVALSVLTSAATPAGAQVVFTSRPLFEALLASPSTLTFDAPIPADGYVPPPPGGSFPLYGPLDGLSFDAAFPDVDSRVINGTGGTIPAFDWGSGVVYTFQNISAPSNTAVFTSLVGPLNGFGFDYGVVPGTVVYSPNFTVQLVRGGTPSAPIPGAYTGTPNNLQFFGVIDPVPFDAVLVTWETDAPVLDNLTFGVTPTGVVPEPATVALVGGGLLALGAAARRRRTT